VTSVPRGGRAARIGTGAHHGGRDQKDPSRQESLAGVRALMGEILDGPPEFVDLGIIHDWVG